MNAFHKLVDVIKAILVNEPLIVRAVSAAVALGVGFGLNISDDVLSKVTEGLAVLGSILLVIDARSKVTPVANPNLES